MTTICLVRHGETDWNKRHLIQGRINIPLNDTGRNQILMVAKRIKDSNLKFDVFLSSPLNRAVESCRIIKDYINDTTDIIIRENLTEREFGQADEKLICDEIYSKILADDVIGMEKSVDIQKRARDEILEIASIYENKNILITTHSHFIKALYTKLDNTSNFRSYIGNGSLNYIYIKDNKIVGFEFNK